MSSGAGNQVSMGDGELTGRALARVRKELEKFREEEDKARAEGIRIEEVSTNIWHVHLQGAEGTIYAGEAYVLRVTFSNEYPMDSPEVLFIPPAPMHPHIYSNGHICLNILYEDWSPALTVKSVCLSILSMMSSAGVKELPEDNARYTRVPRGNPKLTRFVYHDDGI